MKGGIVERSAVAPKPLGAKPVPQAKPIPLPAPAPKKEVPASQRTQNAPPVANLVSSQSEYSENDELIKNMSPEELQEALAEITSLLSKDSINFLMGNSSQKKTEEYSSNNIHESSDDSDDEPPDLEPQSTQSSNVSQLKDTTDQIASNEMMNNKSDTYHSEYPKIELFDLDGKRIIAKEDAYVVISHAIAKHFNIFSGINPDILLTISRIILSHFCTEHFLWMDDIEDGGAFPLNRALEMSRSQVKMQMISSYKILRGVLMRRDFVVNLPVYATTLASLDMSNSLSTRMLLFRNYSLKYMACIDEIYEFLSTCSSLLSKEQSAIFTKSSIEKMVYVALLSLCATDLPPQIPKLMLFGWRAAATYNPTLLTARLDCLKEFVTSMTEHQLATVIDDRYSFGDFEHPRYVTPHVSRPVNCSYEQWHLDRLESLEFILKDKKEKNQNIVQREEDEEEELDEEESDLTGLEALSPGLSEEDKFILRNRWARVDTVAENEDASSLLYRMIVQSLDDESFRAVACLCLEVLHVLTIHGSDTCREQLQLHVIHPLCSIALTRSGSNPRNGSSSALTGDAKKILQYPELLSTLLPLATLSFLQSRFVLLIQALQFQSDISTGTNQYFVHHNAIFKAIRYVLQQSSQESSSIKSSTAPTLHVGRTLSPLLGQLPWSTYFENVKYALMKDNQIITIPVGHFCELGLHFFLNVLVATVATPVNENEESKNKGKLQIESFEELMKWLFSVHSTSGKANELLQTIMVQYLLPMMTITKNVQSQQRNKEQYTSVLSSVLPVGISPSLLASFKSDNDNYQTEVSSLWSLAQSFGMTALSIQDITQTILTYITDNFNKDGSSLCLLQWANHVHLLVTKLWWTCFSFQNASCDMDDDFAAVDTVFTTLLTLTVHKYPHLLQLQRVQDGLFLRTLSARLQQSLVLLYLKPANFDVKDSMSFGLDVLEAFQDNTGSTLAFSFLQWWLASHVCVASPTSPEKTTHQSRIVHDIVCAMVAGDERHKLKLRFNKQLQRRWKQGTTSHSANVVNLHNCSKFITWPLPKKIWMFRGWSVLSLSALTAYLSFIVNTWSVGRQNHVGVGWTLEEMSFCWHQLMRLLRREAASKWYMYFDGEEEDEEEKDNTAVVVSSPRRKQSMLYEATAWVASIASLLLKEISAVSDTTVVSQMQDALSKRFAAEYMLTQQNQQQPASQVQVKEEHKRRQEAMLAFQASILDNMLNYTVGDLDRLAAVSLWLLTVPWQPFPLRRKFWQELSAQHAVSLFVLFPVSRTNHNQDTAVEESEAINMNREKEYAPYKQLLRTLLEVQEHYYRSSGQEDATAMLTSSQFGYHQEIWEVTSTCRLSSVEISSLVSSMSQGADNDDDIHLLIMRYLMRHIVFFIVLGSTVVNTGSVEYNIDNPWSVALLKRVCEDLRERDEWWTTLFLREMRRGWRLKGIDAEVISLSVISCITSTGCVALSEMLPQPAVLG